MVHDVLNSHPWGLTAFLILLNEDTSTEVLFADPDESNDNVHRVTVAFDNGKACLQPLPELEMRWEVISRQQAQRFVDAINRKPKPTHGLKIQFGASVLARLSEYAKKQGVTEETACQLIVERFLMQQEPPS